MANTVNFFKDRREELDLSQRQMAMRLGVSNTAVSSWEKAEALPRLPVKELAAGYEVLEVRIEDALTMLRREMEAATAAK